jgi:hypothetical protein
MPTDLKQRIAQMKVTCEQAASWNSTEAADFRRLVTPVAVLALIAEIERLERENAQLANDRNAMLNAFARGRRR